MADDPTPDRSFDDLSRVSFHAVTRYVQRISKVEIPIEGAVPPKLEAHLHCRAIRRTIRSIRAEILTPGVAIAIRAGFPEVGTRLCRVLVEQPAGVITTIAEPYPHMTGRMQMPSERELRQRGQRAARRRRRRPSIATEAGS
jgi:hypothetical protein